MENLSRENYKDFILYDLLSSGKTMTKYPFNTEGLNTTFRYLKDLLNDKHPDIMAIAETWLNDEHANDKELYLPTYKCYRRDRDLSYYPSLQKLSNVVC